MNWTVELKFHKYYCWFQIVISSYYLLNLSTRNNKTWFYKGVEIDHTAKGKQQETVFLVDTVQLNLDLTFACELFEKFCKILASSMQTIYMQVSHYMLYIAYEQ